MNLESPVEEGIKEVSEVVSVVTTLYIDAVRAKADDGKITKFEAAKILFLNLAGVAAAMEGISKVPAELKDLTEIEMDQLYFIVMGNTGLSRTADTETIVNAIYRVVREAKLSWELIQNTLHPQKGYAITDPSTLTEQD